MERRLAAIVAADVVGYSRMIRADEDGTLSALRGARTEVVEFSSAVDAVECAVKVQKKFKKENARFVEDNRLEFRIGINIGDVIIEANATRV